MSGSASRPLHHLQIGCPSPGRLQQEGCNCRSVAGDSARVSRPRAATEVNDPPPICSSIKGQIEQIAGSTWPSYLDEGTFAGDDPPVSEFLYPAVPARSKQVLESRATKPSSADRSPNPNIHKDWRLKAAAGFDSVNSLKELGRRIPPAVVAEGKNSMHLMLPFSLRSLPKGSSADSPSFKRSAPGPDCDR